MADRRRGGGGVPVLRVRADRGDPVARPHRLDAARPDRPRRRGEGPARARRPGGGQGRHVARTIGRRADRRRGEGPRPGGGRPGAAGRG